MWESAPGRAPGAGDRSIRLMPESAPGVPRRAVTFFLRAQKESNQRKNA